LSTAATDIRLVIFDWAGTTIDFGSCAPVTAFVRTFAAHGVSVTTAEARGPMGLPKRDHLRAMLQVQAVAQRWREAHGRDWIDNDLTRLYDDFLPRQLAALDEHDGLVPGVLDCAAALRAGGVRVAAATGYFREAAARVRAAAARQGFVPELSICVDDVTAGRPAPWMVFRIMEVLNVYPPAAVVKVGDTAPDVEEGRNAGAWSVGVTSSSSEVGCGAEEYGRLLPAQRRELLTAARTKLEGAGAHVVIETLAELPGLISSLNDRLRAGARP
jgi:phosphonoacetaldehyde hydrolase